MYIYKYINIFYRERAKKKEERKKWRKLIKKKKNSGVIFEYSFLLNLNLNVLVESLETTPNPDSFWIGHKDMDFW